MESMFAFALVTVTKCILILLETGAYLNTPQNSWKEIKKTE